jgi:hypothetical protein
MIINRELLILITCQIIKTAVESILPCESKELDKLSDAELPLIVRSRFKQQVALAFSYFDSSDLVDKGLGSYQDAPVSGLDPVKETADRNNPMRLLESNAPAAPI